MPEPDLAPGAARFDPGTSVEAKEVARRLVQHLRRSLNPAAYGVLREYVRASGHAKLSHLAAAFGVSPATATRAVQALGSLVAHERATLGAPAFRAICESLPLEFEEAA